MECPCRFEASSAPALVALFLTVASLHLLNAWHSRRLARIAGLMPRAAPWVALAAGVAVLAIGIQKLATVASASDPSGYPSQADLWLEGELRVPQPDVGPRPWPEAPWTFFPLGYRPDTGGQSIVPTYAPGLPILMALATLVAGACAPYFIGPLCAALLVWATYAIGSRIAASNLYREVKRYLF